MDEFKDQTPQKVKEISTKYCLEIVNKLSDYCDGYYIMTPLKKIDLVCNIIDKINL